MANLVNIEKAIELIETNKLLLFAGEEELLRQLPRGNWIGGTIPYFMGDEGGEESREKLQVFALNEEFSLKEAAFYGPSELEKISQEYPDNGLSFIIVPAMTEVHQRFAEEVPTFPSTFNSPLVGWISGMHLSDLGKKSAKVVNGLTGEVSEDRALVLHLNLPEARFARIDILNMFEQGEGDVLTFDETGFSATKVRVNGEEKDLVTFLKENEVDTRLPLVADYMGAMVNVSFQAVNEEEGKVDFYAPVFPGVEYKIAKPFGDYVETFGEQVAMDTVEPAFSCNCILNYLYGELEGKKTGSIKGPMTFGEIAYMLLNQTLVYVTIEDKAE